jgi:REP element-mobilizing transposase RayT
MPRAPRIQPAGELFHIATRSSAKRAIFPTDGDRDELLRLVQVAFRKYGVACHAYCVLTTHFHVLVTPQEDNLSRAMQWLNSRYAEGFNAGYGVHGHVVGARYSSTHVASDAHLLHLMAYLAYNPIEAGLCQRPEDWPWSSYRAVIGRSRVAFLQLDELLRLFAFDRREARCRIEDYVRGFEATGGRTVGPGGTRLGSDPRHGQHGPRRRRGRALRSS